MTDPEPILTIAPFTPDDAPEVLALNQANVPEVGPMDEAKLLALAAEADDLPVVKRDGEVVGFAILLTEGCDYSSPNYAWFSQRNPRFYYVDRIAIGEGARGQGLGAQLYRRATARAAETRRPVLCAEVNTIPPNPASQAFHARCGFEEVGRLRPYGPDAEVAMLERSVAPA